MAQKFIGFDDAAEQLGISKDVLSELREGGNLRAYRDGTSWKFRSDDIEKLPREGLPAASTSGVDLAGRKGGDDELSLSLDDFDSDTGGSDSVESVSDTLNLDDDDEESILLSESELGDSPDRPPSTIIGKIDLGPGSDLDLELGEEADRAATSSDVNLVGASNVLPGQDEAMDALLASDSHGSFDDIDEI
jgi:excisionase family DNA binding protein